MHIFLQPTRASFIKFHPQSFFGDGIIILANQPNHELYMCSQLMLRASPPVLLQTVKFIVKKSKCAGLVQEIGFFSAPNSCRLPWLVKGAPSQKSVINWT